MKNTMIKMLLFLAITSIFSFCAKEEENDNWYQPRTEIGKAFYAADEVNRIYSDTTFVVAIGVEETDVHFQVMNGYIVRACILKIDTRTPGLQLRVSMPDDIYELKGARQTLTDMAAVHDKAGGRVVGMINGDFWDTGLLIPRGPIHRNGVIVNEVFNYSANVPQQALSFFAVLRDGSMTVDYREAYPQIQADIKEATGAGVVLVKDGKIPLLNSLWKARDPRCAIGYTSDGIVYCLVADGRQDFYSYGMTYAEMASIFYSLGCEGAANLDGGGSAQMLIRHPIARVWQIRNSPSDGSERAVFNGWMVTVDEP